MRERFPDTVLADLALLPWAGMLAPWFTDPARWRPSLAALPWPSGPRRSVRPGS